MVFIIILPVLTVGSVVLCEIVALCWSENAKMSKGFSSDDGQIGGNMSRNEEGAFFFLWRYSPNLGLGLPP
jgi:hypothetical protein